MKNTPRLLAYCSDNKNTADRFDSDLSKAGISFTHYTCRSVAGNSMAKELLKKEGDIFLMISDNFLKSSLCMVDALELLAKGLQQKRIQAIIVDAADADASGAKSAPRPTQFSRISDLINYMNFWQERYLKLRKEKDNVAKNEVDDFDKELKRVRIISAEIGEFLRILRDTDYWTMDQLQEDHYALFFNKIGKQDLIIPFQKEQITTRTPDEQIEDVKKELDIASSEQHENIPAPEETDTAQLTEMQMEQQKIQEDFSGIFEEEDEEKTEEIRSDDSDQGSFQNWDDLDDLEEDNELTHTMQKRFFERIDLLMGNGDESTAARELKQFLKVNKKSARAHYQLALMALSNEQFDEAKYHAEQAVELRPDDSQYHLNLGRILFHHFSENPKSAEQSFKNAIQLNPANLAAHYEYAMLLHEVLKKPNKAISQLELTLAIQPEHPFANYDLALIYYGMNKREKAAMYYEKAFNINPELRTPDNDIAFWYESHLEADDTETETSESEIPQTKNPKIADTFLDPEEALMYEMEEEDNSDHTNESMLDNDEEVLLDNEIHQIIEQKESILSTPVPVTTKKSSDFSSDVQLKTVLITGATSGIGEATARLFASHGHRLILTGRREGRLNELKSELQRTYNNDITILDFDVRYLSAAKKSFNSLSEEWSAIDLLINNAGLAKGLDPIHEGDIKHWEIMLDTNVKGLLFMTRIVSPGMVARKSGHIINVCSSAGHEVYPKGAVYCATKHAVDALTKGMRLDLYQHGIRVGQVSPGHVEETEFAVVRFDGDKERAKIYDDFQPLKSSDVADAIFYMANAPKHVTIQDIVMMGTQQASSTFIDRSGR